MNKENIKKIIDKVIAQIQRFPIFTRILTQFVLFITTFQLHTSSPFWHVVCLCCMILITVQNVTDGKAKKALLSKSEEVVGILTDAISDMVANGDVEIGGELASDILEELKDEQNSETEEENAEETEENAEENAEEEAEETEETEEELKSEQE